MKTVAISEKEAWEMLDNKVRLERMKDFIEFHAIALNRIGLLSRMTAILVSKPYSGLKEG